MVETLEERTLLSIGGAGIAEEMLASSAWPTSKIEPASIVQIETDADVSLADWKNAEMGPAAPGTPLNGSSSGEQDPSRGPTGDTGTVYCSWDPDPDYFLPDMNGMQIAWDVSGSPAGATVTTVDYRLWVGEEDVGGTDFYCLDYGITLTSSAGGSHVAWNHLGSRTDGGYDDDAENDYDIYLDGRSTSVFSGQTVDQRWTWDIQDTGQLDDGKIAYVEFWINYQYGGSSDDAYEQNDTLATAYDLSTREGTWLSTLAGPGIQADDDWYRIDVTPGYENLSVDLQFTHSQGDIDLAVYNSSGGYVTGSAGITNGESIDYLLPSSGTYYLRVYYGNAGNQYDLWWDDLASGTAPVISPLLPDVTLDEDGEYPPAASEEAGDGSALPADPEGLTPLGFDGDLNPLGDSTETGTRYRIFDVWGGAWSDAEKDNGAGDDLMCWAGAASNMLEWTGWGEVGGMTNTDQMFQYFQDHFTDEGSLACYGWDWWFDGTNPSQGWSGWAQEDVQGGAFYTALDPDDYIHTRGQGSTAEAYAMKDVDEYCRAGYGVSLGLFGSISHAITCWGFNYNPALAPSDPNYYVGLWITDSDDNKYTSNGTTAPNVLHYYNVQWDSVNARYNFNAYYSGCYIGEVDGLERAEEPHEELDLWDYASDAETSDDGLTYTIVGNTHPQCGVEIVGNRYVEVHPNANWNGVSDVTIRVTDPQGNYSEDTLRVTVNPVNDQPTAVSVVPGSVDENQPAGTTVGTFSTADPDTGDTFVYAFVSGTGSGDNGSFTIAGNQLKTKAAFDYETKSSYSIRVKATDSGGLAREEALTISVNNLPETALPGDANGDGTVNNADAAILAAHWGMSGMDWDDGDFNDDDVVNAADASILAANWGATVTPPGEETPAEPVVEPEPQIVVGPVQVERPGSGRRSVLQPVADAAVMSDDAAHDAALASEYGLQSEAASLGRSSALGRLAWSHVLARRARGR